MHLLAVEMARLRYQEAAALAERAEARQRHALRSDRGQRNAWLRSMWSPMSPKTAAPGGRDQRSRTPRGPLRASGTAGLLR